MSDQIEKELEAAMERALKRMETAPFGSLAGIKMFELAKSELENYKKTGKVWSEGSMRDFGL